MSENYKRRRQCRSIKVLKYQVIAEEPPHFLRIFLYSFKSITETTDLKLKISEFSRCILFSLTSIKQHPVIPEHSNKQTEQQNIGEYHIYCKEYERQPRFFWTSVNTRVLINCSICGTTRYFSWNYNFLKRYQQYQIDVIFLSKPPLFLHISYHCSPLIILSRKMLLYVSSALKYFNMCGFGLLTISQDQTCLKICSLSMNSQLTFNLLQHEFSIHLPIREIYNIFD